MLRVNFLIAGEIDLYWIDRKIYAVIAQLIYILQNKVHKTSFLGVPIIKGKLFNKIKINLIIK